MYIVHCTCVLGYAILYDSNIFTCLHVHVYLTYSAIKSLMYRLSLKNSSRRDAREKLYIQCTCTASYVHVHCIYMYMYSVESNDGEDPAGHKYHHTVQHLFSIACMYIHVHVVKEVTSFWGTQSCDMYTCTCTCENNTCLNSIDQQEESCLFSHVAVIEIYIYNCRARNKV